MKCKILGAYSFKSKNDKSLTNLSVTEERQNCVGTCTTNVLSLSDNLPESVDKMVGKEYIIDCRYTNGSAFASAFYPVK